jgi:hypothetical protein
VVSFLKSTNIAPNSVKIDAVIQTFTRTDAECTTWLGRVEEGFPLSLNTDRLNTPQFDLEENWPNVLRHRAVFRDLIPGAYYHYRVDCRRTDPVGDVFANTESVFRAPPPPDDPGDTQIALFSDRFSKTQPKEYENHLQDWKDQCWGDNAFYLTLKKLRELGDLDLVLMPGDIAQGGDYGWGTPSGSYFGYVTRFQSMFELIWAGTPMLTVPGNHDIIDTGFYPGDPSGDFQCRPGNVRKFFDVMPTPLSRDHNYRNQWWSLDWGNTHIAGLELLGDEGQRDGILEEADKCNLSKFTPGTEQRNWLLDDLSRVQTSLKWRLVAQHGLPNHRDGRPGQILPTTGFDSSGFCGLAGKYERYCQDMNAKNVDLVFAGHTSHGLRRHLMAGGRSQDLLYAYRTDWWTVTHLRLRSDAIVVSSIVPNGIVRPEVNAYPGLYECYKYVPGVKEGCDASVCRTRTYNLERIVHPDCTVAATNLMVADQLFDYGDNRALLVPCCRAPDPNDHSRCVDAGGVSVPRVVAQSIQECDRDKIAPGCLRRQMVPIVMNPGSPPVSPHRLHVTNVQLLRECTPCEWGDAGGVEGITNYAPSCGMMPSEGLLPLDWLVPVLY